MSKTFQRNNSPDLNVHTSASFPSTTGEKDIKLSCALTAAVEMGAKKTESLLFSLLTGESSRENAAISLHGVTATGASERRGEPSVLAGNRRTTFSGDIIPRLSVRAGVLVESDGDTNMVVLGMGVMWREFGDGVSISERYLRMCIGVLPVLGSPVFIIEGLMKLWGSSGGVRFTFSLTSKSSDSVSLSAWSRFSKMLKVKKANECMITELISSSYKKNVKVIIIRKIYRYKSNLVPRVSHLRGR